MTLAAVGVVLGVAGALMLGSFLRSLLFQVQPTDPATFLSIPLLLILVALLATYLPARRAARTDAMVSLRCE